MSSVNKKLDKYFNYYLNEVDKPDYGVMLDGLWGEGKTYYMNNYLSSRNNSEEIYIHINLFGKNNLNQVNDDVLIALYPFMGTKIFKTGKYLAQNLLNISLKVPIDLDGDGKSDGTSKVNINLDDEMKKLSGLKRSKKIIYIFDEIERTNIPLDLIMGYIHSILEKQNSHVIIIGNEESLRKSSKYGSVYDEYKNKIIARTLKIRPEIGAALDEIILIIKNDKLIKEKELILKHIKNIENINLRILRQVLLEFDFFWKEVINEGINFNDYTDTSINKMMLEFIELGFKNKSGELYEYEHYSIFQKDIWISCFEKGYLEKEEFYGDMKKHLKT